MSTTTVNYALYQTGWLAAILGAALHQEAVGVSLALLLTAVHVALVRERRIEIRLLVGVVAAGYILESLQLAAGTYHTQTTLLPDGSPAAWLLVLWAQFATTFRFSLRRILQHPVWAILFGALGGPLAFVAADRLGALDLLAPVSHGMLRLALAWAVALGGFSWLTRRWSASASEPTYRGFPTPSSLA